MNSTVLIHEATFEDAMVAEAIAKRHSTIGEAIQVGTKCVQQCIRLCLSVIIQFMCPFFLTFACSTLLIRPCFSWLLRMNAERILLTHFSQRYPKIPMLHEDGAPTGAGTHERRVCIAFDCMSVAFHRLRWLPLLLPSFKWLFPPETVEPANASLGAE